MSKPRYTLDDIRRRKTEVERQIAAERAEMQATLNLFRHPATLLPAITPWRSFKTAFKFATRVVSAYKMVSSVVSLFRRRR